MIPMAVQELCDAMPNCKAHAALYLPHLNAAMVEFEITTPARATIFLAQLAHESGELRWFEEFADGSAYEGRKDLGNTVAGDGKRYKGRGPIQLTGRANYDKVGKALGVDLVNNPLLAKDPKIAFRVAAYFWKSHGLNEIADALDFKKATKVINGGQNGLADREKHWARIKKVFGVA